jgi:PKD repeat protein
MLQLDASTVTVQEGGTATNRGSVQDPGADLVGLKASVGRVILNADNSWLWSFPTSDGPDQSQTVTITATDSDGATTSQSFALVVTNVAPQITVDQGSVTFNEGDEAVNSGTFSEPGSDFLRFSASVGDITALADGTWRWSYICPDGPGDSQAVVITATDSDGASSQASFDLVVRNVVPTVDAGSDVSVVAGVPFRFQGRFVDPGILDTHTIRWDFGDGNTATGTLQPVYTYLNPGTYTATLTITDREGAENKDSIAVRALPASATPGLSATPSSPTSPVSSSSPAPAPLAPRLGDLEAGTFVVGSQGVVTVDFLADFGSYQSELGLFSLDGMEALPAGSAAFIREAVQRVLSRSELGSLLYSEYSEGARLRGELGEQDHNRFDYVAPRSSRFTPGSRVAFVLIPNGTFRQLLDNPASEGDRRPLFSIASANPGQYQQFGKLATETRDGAVFGFEDIRRDRGTDADYNDFLIQVNGASALAPALASLIDPSRSWLELPLGRQLTSLATSSDSPSSQAPAITNLSLLTDTGFSSFDRLSRDITLVGQISSPYAIHSLQASLRGATSLLDVSQWLAADGSFRLASPELDMVYGGPLPDGFHTLTLLATDVWDQTSQFVSLSFIKDTQAPEPAALITISDVQSLSPTLFGEAEVGSRLLVQQQGLSLVQTTSPGLWEARLNDLASGAIPLAISITDAAGNKGVDASYVWVLDPKAPRLTLLSPTRYQLLSSSSRLIGRVSEQGKSFDRLEIQFDSGPRQMVSYAIDNSFDMPIDVSDLSPGYHSLTLHISYGGNQTYAVSMMVTI